MEQTTKFRNPTLKEKIDHISRKGYLSELRIFNALKELKDDKQVEEVVDFISSTHSGDSKGVDFYIICIRKSQRCLVYLQVKSSKRGQEEHMKFSTIPSIKVEDKSMITLEEEITEIIKNSLYFNRTIHK